MRTGIVALVVLLAAAHCGVFQRFFATPGEVRVATTAGAGRGKVALGFIEDRNDRFTPFATENLRDMLRYEFIDRDYRIVDLDLSALQPPAPATTAPPARENQGSRSTPNATDLLPQRLQQMAGELSAYRLDQDPRRRLLTPAEIAKVGAAQDFDFFVQGAVATTERGVLLEVEQDSLVFLHIFARNGERLGVINFTVSRENLRAAEFLRDVTARLAGAFAGQFRK